MLTACLGITNFAAERRSQRLQISRGEVDRELKATKDPRAPGTGDVFDSYPRFPPMRPELSGFAEEGAYNPKYKR